MPDPLCSLGGLCSQLSSLLLPSPQAGVPGLQQPFCHDVPPELVGPCSGFERHVVNGHFHLRQRAGTGAQHICCCMKIWKLGAQRSCCAGVIASISLDETLAELLNLSSETQAHVTLSAQHCLLETLDGVEMIPHHLEVFECLTLSLGTALAQLPGSCFDGLDGGVQVSAAGPEFWQQLACTLQFGAEVLMLKLLSREVTA